VVNASAVFFQPLALSANVPVTRRHIARHPQRMSRDLLSSCEVRCRCARRSGSVSLAADLSVR